MKIIFQDGLFIKRVGSRHILPKSDVDSAELAVLLMMNTRGGPKVLPSVPTRKILCLPKNNENLLRIRSKKETKLSILNEGKNHHKNFVDKK